MTQHGTFELTLLKAQDLQDVEIWGRQDPYCSIQIGAQQIRSKVHTDGGRHPVWNEKFVFHRIPINATIEFKVYDKNMMLRDVRIGTGRLALQPELLRGKECHVPLSTVKHKPAGHVVIQMAHSLYDGQLTASMSMPARHAPALDSMQPSASFKQADVTTAASMPQPGLSPFSSNPMPNQTAMDIRRQWILPDYGGKDITADYSFEQKALGEGAFAVTYLVTCKSTGAQYACKSVSKAKVATALEVEDIRREVAMLQALRGHPHVVQLHDAYEDKLNVHLLLQYCRGGELFDRIMDAERYSERDAADTIRTIIQTVADCHKAGIIHRDIKPENFLYLEPTREATMVLTDFNTGTFWSPGQEPLQEIVGSPYYLAPEVLRRSYGPAVDLWSCGVILYILLCGGPPFNGESEKRIFESILRDAPLDLHTDPWPHISEGARDCVSRLLVKDPRKRATAQEILAHPWLVHGGASDSPMAVEVLNRMKCFKQTNRLKQAALQIIARNLPASELEELRSMFKAIDADGSGTITIDELRNAVKTMGSGGLGEEQLQALMAHADADGDGEIDYQEFLVATLNMQRMDREDQLRVAFAEFDADGSGTISKEELMAALARMKLDMGDIEDIIADADQDGDGCIDYYEFCELMRAL